MFRIVILVLLILCKPISTIQKINGDKNGDE